MQNVLFVCSQNKLRSPTAEIIFSKLEGFNVRSAGLNSDAKVPLEREHIEWADVVFVMEPNHKAKIKKKIKSQITTQRLICLGIPDIYEFMDAELIAVLEKCVPPFLHLSA